MSAAVATTPSEGKIYISSATLQLKVNTQDYVWQTKVLTPPVTPVTKETEVVAEHVNKTNAAGLAAAATVAAGATGAAVGALHQHQNSTNKQAAKPVTIVKAVSNFMEAERYHTEHIENMNQFVSKI